MRINPSTAGPLIRSPLAAGHSSAAPIADQDDPQDLTQISPSTPSSSAVSVSPAKLAALAPRTNLLAALPALSGPSGAALLKLPDGTFQPYPQAPKSDQVDSYFGISVPDPYRSLEAQNSPVVQSWVNQENQLTRQFLDQIPGRDKIHAAVVNAVHRDVKGLPVVGGDTLYYLKSDGFSQGVICSSDLQGKNEKVIFDPNPLSAEGLVAVNSFKPSPDGTRLAIGVVTNGTDWVDWKIKDLKTGQDLPGDVRSSKFGDGLQWSDDSQGFYYGRYQRPSGDAELVEPDERLGLYFHRVGTPESADQAANPPGMVRSDKPPQLSLGRTRALPREDLSSLLPDTKDSLQNVVKCKDEIVAHYLQDGHSRLERFDSQGNSLGAIALPQIGAIYDVHTSKDEVYFDFSGPAYPPTVFHYKPGENKAEVLWQARSNYNPANYDTSLQFSTSPDGARIPLYLTRRKDTPLNDQRPTFLYGYGGFDVPEFPDNKSNLNIIPWLDMGGIFVDTCLRGGNEYNEPWHQDGMLLNKQHVFSDFESAGDYLMKEKITGPGKLAAGGRSNGGLLAAATELQRPGLFSAVVPEVGVMDLMRFPRFTCGYQWVSEYGSVNNEADVKNMLAYSPINNVQAGRSYPSTLFMTADHDDRVPPGAHTYKQAALLQQAQGSDNPILMRVEPNAGHGSFDHPWPTAKLIGQDTDRWSFLAYKLGMPSAS